MTDLSHDRLAQLCEDLKLPGILGLSDVLRNLSRVSLLIIDEIGDLPLHRE
jgi:DNA replication protein DnaC